MPAIFVSMLRTALCFSILAAVAQVRADSTSGILWQSDLDAARVVARQEGKLVLIHFYTESCGPCKMLDATVFNQPTVGSIIASNYVPVKLNANEFPVAVQQFGITRVPTDVVITPEGQVIEKLICPGTPMAYIAKMSGLAEQHKREAGRAFQQSPPNSGTTQPLHNAYAGLAVPTTPNETQAPANVPPLADVVTNPFAASMAPEATPTEPQPVVPVVPNADRYASQPSPAVEQQPMMNQSAQSTPPVNTPITLEVAPVTVAVQPPAVAPAADKVADVQLPAGSPPLGFDGYCPVSMKQSWEWTKGDVRFGAVHRGRTYLFTGAEQRDEFLRDPDAYAPALSGIDPVLAIDENKKEPGTRQFAVEYRGQFYMFSSEETLRKFWTQADVYSQGVRQAMNAAPDRTLR